jgi:hypothetical protein
VNGIHEKIDDDVVKPVNIELLIDSIEKKLVESGPCEPPVPSMQD